MFWHDLITTALLGTQQHPVPTADGQLGTVLNRLTATSPEQRLLKMVALTAVYQQTGTLPAKESTPLTAPCVPDDQARCTSRAAYFLSIMLDGTHKAVLDEFLTALSAHDQRVLEEKIPALLNAGSKDSSLRSLIQQTIGRRGHWLAAQNRQWSYAAIADHLDESIWQTGNLPSRLLLLEQVRKADPAHARELLVSSWQEDSADERTAFIETLERIALSMDDEPFLEGLLDTDRSVEVRSAVCHALACLPDSRLVQRMTERALPLIQAVQGDTFQLEVTLPNTLTDEMIRDGIKKAGPTGKGEKSFWLSQMVSAVPLDVWVDHLKASPAELIQAAIQADWKDLLIGAWAAAACTQQNTVWIEQILVADPDISMDLVTLLKGVPADRIESIAQTLLVVHGLFDGHFSALDVLSNAGIRWSEPFSRQIWAALRQELSNPNNTNRHYVLQSALNTFALAMTPASWLVEEAESLVQASLDTPWEKMLTDFAATLRFRHEMHQELNR